MVNIDQEDIAEPQFLAVTVASLGVEAGGKIRAIQVWAFTVARGASGLRSGCSGPVDGGGKGGDLSYDEILPLTEAFLLGALLRLENDEVTTGIGWGGDCLDDALAHQFLVDEAVTGENVAQQIASFILLGCVFDQRYYLVLH